MVPLCVCVCVNHFYASLYHLKPARLFIVGPVTCKSGIYDHSDSIGEGDLCARVCADGGCCYRIAAIRRQTVRWFCRL